VFASAYALIRIALSELPPVTVAAVRFLLACSVMLPIVLVRYRRQGTRIRKSDWPMLLVLCVLQIYLPNLLQNVGLEYTSASLSSVLQSTTPVFTLLLSAAFLRETVGWREIVGVAAAMTGVTLLSTGGDFASIASSTFFGNVLQVGVGVSYAISGIIGKVALRRYEALFVVTLTFVGGALLLAVSAIALEESAWPKTVSNEVILALLLLSFLYCLGLVSWYDVLQRTSVFQLYVLLFTMPVLAVIISVITLGEAFTILDVVFSALTLAGVAITQAGKQR